MKRSLYLVSKEIVDILVSSKSSKIPLLSNQVKSNQNLEISSKYFLKESGFDKSSIICVKLLLLNSTKNENHLYFQGIISKVFISALVLLRIALEAMPEPVPISVKFLKFSVLTIPTNIL